MKNREQKIGKRGVSPRAQSFVAPPARVSSSVSLVRVQRLLEGVVLLVPLERAASEYFVGE